MSAAFADLERGWFNARWFMPPWYWIVPAVMLAGLLAVLVFWRPLQVFGREVQVERARELFVLQPIKVLLEGKTIRFLTSLILTIPVLQCPVVDET